MAHAPQRWLGIVLRHVRGHYPDARLVAWGPWVEGAVASTAAAPGDRPRLELAFLDPPDPPASVLNDIRAALEASDIPVDTDLRLFGDLTMAEQNEVLERGQQFGG